VQLAQLSLLLAAILRAAEPPISLSRGRTDPSRIVLPSSRDREFESISLQRRVCCELDHAAWLRILTTNIIKVAGSLGQCRTVTNSGCKMPSYSVDPLSRAR
jgi:hypothetical protein